MQSKHPPHCALAPVMPHASFCGIVHAHICVLIFVNSYTHNSGVYVSMGVCAVHSCMYEGICVPLCTSLFPVHIRAEA